MCPISENPFYVVELLIFKISAVVFILALILFFASLFSKRVRPYRKYSVVTGVLVLFILFGTFLFGLYAKDIMADWRSVGPAYSGTHIQDFLMSKYWRGGECFGPAYLFKPDGTFVYQADTDFNPHNDIGKWELQDLGNGNAILTLIGEEKPLDSPSNKRVTIQVGNVMYQGQTSLKIHVFHKHINIDSLPYWGEPLPNK